MLIETPMLYDIPDREVNKKKKKVITKEKANWKSVIDTTGSS